MKTLLITAFALTAAAAPLSAASLKVDMDALTVTQQAQLFGILDSDENHATRERLIRAVLDDGNATPETISSAQKMFIKESDESSATRMRLLDAISD